MVSLLAAIDEAEGVGQKVQPADGHVFAHAQDADIAAGVAIRRHEADGRQFARRAGDLARGRLFVPGQDHGKVFLAAADRTCKGDDLAPADVQTDRRRARSKPHILGLQQDRGGRIRVVFTHTAQGRLDVSVEVAV